MEFLTGCGSSVAAETGNSLLAKIKRHIGYLFHYNNNMKGLEDARDNLEAKRNDASRLVADVSTKFRDVSSAVTHWGNAAEKLHKEAETIITGNNRRSSCPNPWSRYSSSKKAWKLTQEINEKVRSAPDFGTTFERPAPESGAKFNLTGSVDFDSRLTILNGVLEALKDEEVSMCSICGMGGVGKTTLAKKLIQQVEALHLFDKVVMVTVSQNPNFEKIQTEIIELLGLKIDERTMLARANKLNDWLTNNKTLLILDDVWRMLNDKDFEAIGIPSVNKGRKILFTSRNEDECNKMGSQRNFRVGVLERGEAWDLFREKAGKRAEDLSLHETARDIAAECGGLPIAIVTIATALKNKPHATWNDSLLRLRKSNLSVGISDMEKVYSRIGLSYDLLDDKEAQSCFRICCLYPEDYNIPIEDLVLYGKSLDLFESVDTMKEARDRVESIIHKLRTSFLLLDGYSDCSVKMHDVLRDFAVSISSKAENPYVIKCENTVMAKWPETSKYNNCSAISIMCAQMKEHPVYLECPKLELLQLNFGKDSKPLQASIFEGMKELKVLSLKAPSVLNSVTLLKKLRGLFVTEKMSRNWSERKLPELDYLMNLESFSYQIDGVCYKDFPVEIGLLRNLRFLRLTGMIFEYIPAGVLSKLVKLEELYLPQDFVDWGCKEYMGTRINASLDEIESLPLTALEIRVPKGSVLAEKVANNLTRFLIFLGKSYVPIPRPLRKRNNKSNTLFEAVEVDACDIKASWIRALLRKSEILTFVKVRNLKNFIPELENNGFEQLRTIYIDQCKEMEYLVDKEDENIPWSSSSSFSQLESLELLDLDNLKEICHFGPTFSPLLFPNLTEIDIYRCSKLKSVFPRSLARGLSQLRRMYIGGCDVMLKVFHADEVDDDNQQMNPIIIFPQLKFLNLTSMRNLRVFYDGNYAIKLPSLESLVISKCNKMDALSYGSCTAPLLQQILINKIADPVGEEDVNAFLKKKFLELRNTMVDVEYLRSGSQRASSSSVGTGLPKILLRSNQIRKW